MLTGSGEVRLARGGSMTASARLTAGDTTTASYRLNLHLEVPALCRTVDTRTAAYMLAIDRVAYDTRMRGIYA